jgi:putative flippase GtrA
VQYHAIITPTRRARAGQIVKFACVGCIGVAVNTVILYILSRWLGVPLAASSAIAIELAIISNYFINDRWTFASHATSIRRFAKFNVASLSGLSVNVAAVWLLARLGIYFLAANLLGITLGFASNYALSSVWVWGRTPCR